MQPEAATRASPAGNRLAALGAVRATALARRWDAAPVEGTLNALTIVLGVWTLYCNGLMRLGVGFGVFLALSPLALAAAVALFLWVSRRLRAPATTVVVAGADVPAGEVADGVLTFAFFAGAAALVNWYAHTGDYDTFWLGAALLVLLGLLRRPGTRPPGVAPAPFVQEDARWVWLGAAATALLYLVLHRTDPDDALYGNFIAAALDFPDLPPLRYDLIHGIPDVALSLPLYQVHSHELLNALLTWLAGASEPFVVYHLVSPTLFAAALVLVYWSLFRELLPRLALTATLVAVLVLLFWGDGHRVFGNFGLVRLFQGKSVMVTVLVPLLVLQAVRFVRNPDPARWVLLALVNAAMVGASSTGLMVAPMLTAAVFVGWLLIGHGHARVALLGLAAAGYPLLVGWIGWLESSPAELYTLQRDVEAYTRSGLLVVLGGGTRGLIALWAVIACASIPAREGAWGLVRGVALGSLLLLSPWTAESLARLTTDALRWRLFWAVPFTFLMVAASVYAASWLPRMRAGRSLPAALALLVAAALFAAQPGHWSIQRENRVALDIPGLRTDPAYAVAREVVRLTPSKAMLVAPEEVGLWVPTIRGYPYVMCSRPGYLHRLEEAVGEWVVRVRRQMCGVVAGDPRHREHGDFFMVEVEERCVYTVVMHTGVPWLETIAARLLERGYRRRDVGGYAIYYWP